MLSESPPFPEQDEIHLWRLSLRPPPPSQNVLSSEEVCRLQAFRFEKDRHRFLHTHIATRRILASYLRACPADLAFATGPFGKPTLTHPTPSLQFNLSYSHEWALLAISSTQPVGVDLEYRNEALDYDELAASLFTSGELETFKGLQPCDRQHAFFQTWSTKEAFVKCLGTGLNTDLRSVSLNPSSRRIQSTGKRVTPPHFFQHLRFEQDYASALCTPRRIPALHCFHHQQQP